MVKRSENAILVQSILFGALFFAGLAVVATWLDGLIGGVFPKLAGQTRGGISLFFLWLVVTATLRSIHKMSRGVESVKLLLAGITVAIVGAVFAGASHWLVGQFSEGFLPFSVGSRNVLFYGGLGLVVSLISLINLRVQSRFLGDLLELLLIAALAFAFFYFMK